MPRSFKNIPFPRSSQYSSDGTHVPLEFYERAIPLAKTIDMVLGYFSTNAIRTLSLGFAEFIYHGGSLRIVTNHELTALDKENLLVDTRVSEADMVIDIFADIALLKNELGPYGQHFFDCLKFLITNDRMSIQPVMHKPIAMSHYKKVILFDGEDRLYAHGSANFTGAGIIRNGESITVDKSWGSETEQYRLKEERENFELIFSQQHPSYLYLSAEDVIGIIKKAGNTKTEQELLETSLELLEDESQFSPAVREILERRRQQHDEYILGLADEPNFPFKSAPRPYQIEAYNNWKANKDHGLFAMATGTGKTITALNCALSEYLKTGYYRLIVLVPSTVLLDQWEEELLSFNFRNIIKAGGGNNWSGHLANYVSNYKYGIQPDLAIIAINDTFVSAKFQRYYQALQNDFLFIADEAHNLGAANIASVLKSIKPRQRIGLSATPKRIYDPEGTAFLEAFFQDKEPYCYQFTMEQALKEGRLTNYYYYPKLVYLDPEEQEQYQIISRKLLKYFDPAEGKFKDNPAVEILLQERKRIVHRARAKVPCFKEILSSLSAEQKLKYVFTYVPEGINQDGPSGDEKLIYTFIRAANDFDPALRLASYTSVDTEHKTILTAFATGEIDIIFAMKMLDEGVDVPRTEVGIFASSTGNPRQYIQRRGRLLRNHKDKTFATIYDMIVAPVTSNHDPASFRIEQNLLRSELIRVAYFASLSMNFKDTKSELQSICDQYDLDIDTLILELQP